MLTKDKIIVSAIRCFRRSGTQTVTTNHIAASAGISPGNLYYHFHNKEEILRAVFERIVAFMANTWSETLPADREAALTRMYRKLLALYRGYGFFYRDLPELLRKDPILRERYRQVRELRLQEMEKLFSTGREQGWIHGTDAEFAQLVRQLWFVSEYWPVHLDLFDDDRDTRWQDGLLLSATLLRPFLSSEGQMLLAHVAQTLKLVPRKEK